MYRSFSHKHLLGNLLVYGQLYTQNSTAKLFAFRQCQKEHVFLGLFRVFCDLWSFSGSVHVKLLKTCKSVVSKLCLAGWMWPFWPSTDTKDGTPFLLQTPMTGYHASHRHHWWGFMPLTDTNDGAPFLLAATNLHTDPNESTIPPTDTYDGVPFRPTSTNYWAPFLPETPMKGHHFAPQAPMMGHHSYPEYL